MPPAVWAGQPCRSVALLGARPPHLHPPRLTALQARGMTGADVGASARKLRLYRRLRRLDPPGFRALLRPGSRTVYESRVRGILSMAAIFWNPQLDRVHGCSQGNVSCTEPPPCTLPLNCAAGALAPGAGCRVFGVHRSQPGCCCSVLPCRLGVGRRAACGGPGRRRRRAAVAAGAAVARSAPHCRRSVW